MTKSFFVKLITTNNPHSANALIWQRTSANHQITKYPIHKVTNSNPENCTIIEHSCINVKFLNQN